MVCWDKDSAAALRTCCRLQGIPVCMTDTLPYKPDWKDILNFKMYRIHFFFLIIR